MADGALQSGVWRPTSIRVVNAGGESTQRPGIVFGTTPHLAVVSLTDSLWGVTHIASGGALAKYFQTRGAAIAFLTAIVELTDWSTDRQVIQANETLDRELRRLRADIHRRAEDGEFGPVDRDLVAELNRFATRLEEVQPTRELAMRMRARTHRPRKD